MLKSSDMETQNYSLLIAKLIGIRPEQAASAINLLDEGNTIPFISRYRKEATGTLDEEQLRQVEHEYNRMKTLDERRSAIIASMDT